MVETKKKVENLSGVKYNCTIQIDVFKMPAPRNSVLKARMNFLRLAYLEARGADHKLITLLLPIIISTRPQF